MNLFIITTYNLPNLIISLNGLRRFLENDRLHNYALCVNNDNPAYDLKPDIIRRYIPEELSANVLLVNPNGNENLGCLNARIKAITKAYEWAQEKCFSFQFFMFIDDDDVVLTPDFKSDKFEISHRAVVVHRLLEVLTLIERPYPDRENKFIEYEEWKMGCVGVPYNFELYHKFIEHLKGFLPKLYEIYGTPKVMEPDDIIFMNLWHVWMRHFVDDNLDNVIDKKDTYSYALTFLEDRKGRYNIPQGVVDLRYGNNWDGKTTYQSIVQPLIDAYVKYIHETEK